MAASHPRPIGHISLGVRDYAASKAFYTAVLATLGLSLVYDSGDEAKTPTLGYGPDAEHEMVNLFVHGDAARAPGPGSHVAFNAFSRAAVTAFHDAAVRCGGRSNGGPGLRLHYGPAYFAAFVVCPDGWRLEAVCKEEEQGRKG